MGIPRRISYIHAEKRQARHGPDCEIHLYLKVLTVKRLLVMHVCKKSMDSKNRCLRNIQNLLWAAVDAKYLKYDDASKIAKEIQQFKDLGDE